MLTVGLDGAAVENALCSGGISCPLTGCGQVLRPWGWARDRPVRGAGRLRPRRARCRGCRGTQVLLPASVLLRRGDPVAVIGLALLAKAGGAGHRRIAEQLGLPASTVRGWLRRIAAVADRVLAVLAAVAAELGAEFMPPAPTAEPAAAVVELLGGVVPGDDVAAGWFLLAVAAGRGRLWWPVAVPGWSGTGFGLGFGPQHQLALGGRALTRWAIGIGRRRRPEPERSATGEK